MISHLVVAMVLWSDANQEQAVPVAPTSGEAVPLAAPKDMGPIPGADVSGGTEPPSDPAASPPTPSPPEAVEGGLPSSNGLSAEGSVMPPEAPAPQIQISPQKSPNAEAKGATTHTPPESTPRAPPKRPADWSAWREMAGWLISALLIGYLLLLQRPWRIAFQNREWLMMPSQTADQMRESVQHLTRHADALTGRVDRSFGDHAKQIEEIAQVLRDTRSEFSILREELDRKAKEIADLRIGHDFKSRKSILRAVAHVMQIIEEDRHGGRDAADTLKGVVVELEECLQDNNVAALRYEPGTRLADAKGVSTQESIKEQAQEPHLKGTIGETMRPAYVIVGPSGSEEIVRQARVRIYT